MASLKKGIISLTIAIYIRVMQHLAPLLYKQVLALQKSFSIAEKHRPAVGRRVGYHAVELMTTYYPVGKLWRPGTAF